MESLQRQINELHEEEKISKENERKSAEARQSLVSGLETDLQLLLEEKKAEFKVSTLNVPVGCAALQGCAIDSLLEFCWQFI